MRTHTWTDPTPTRPRPSVETAIEQADREAIAARQAEYAAAQDELGEIGHSPTSSEQRRNLRRLSARLVELTGSVPTTVPVVDPLFADVVHAVPTDRLRNATEADLVLELLRVQVEFARRDARDALVALRVEIKAQAGRRRS